MQISVDKKIATPYLGAFDAPHITKFVNGLLTGGVEGSMKLGAKGVGSVTSAPAWDGKDGKLPVEEEEMSLEELGL